MTSPRRYRMAMSINTTCPQDGMDFPGVPSSWTPGAPEQPWSVKHPETPAGAIEKFRLRSERLKNERDLFVYTPAGYRSDGRAPALLIVFDGTSYIDVVPTPVILDNLTAASHIPPVIGVFVDNPDQDTRTRELTPNPEFPEFLAR